MSQCCVMEPDGKHCDAQASHCWGPLPYCCKHFDLLVSAILDIRAAVEQRRHEDFLKEHHDHVSRGQHRLAEENKKHAEIVKIYEDRTGKDSHIPGTDCKGQKP